jgi:hypothetical protein
VPLSTIGTLLSLSLGGMPKNFGFSFLWILMVRTNLERFQLLDYVSVLSMLKLGGKMQQWRRTSKRNVEYETSLVNYGLKW